MKYFILIFSLLVGCTTNQSIRPCTRPYVHNSYGGDCYYCLNGEEINFDCSGITNPSRFGENVVAKKKGIIDSTVVVEFTTQGTTQGIIDSMALPFAKVSKMIVCDKTILMISDGNLYSIDLKNKSYELVQEKVFDVDIQYISLGFFPCANKQGKVSFSYGKSLYMYDYVANDLYEIDYLPNFRELRESNFSSNGEELLYVKNNSIYLYDVRKRSKEIIYTMKKPKREISRAYFVGTNTDTIRVGYTNTTDEKLFMKAWELDINRNGDIVKGRLK